MKKIILLLMALVGLCSWPIISQASNYQQLSVQGMVFDNDGNPLNGSLNVTFRIYDAEDATSPLWEESQVVNFDMGAYSASLGGVTDFPNDLFDKDSLFLGIQVEGDSEMSPRITMNGVPWAQQCEVAVTAQSLDQNAMQAIVAAIPQGPAGPAGPTGPVGSQGPSGPQGLPGSGGSQGLQGLPGPQGLQGPQGDSGPQGSQGSNGLACWDFNGNGQCDLETEDKNNDHACDTNDCQGLKGDQGDKGDKGDQGTQGPTGLQGAVGATGPQGPKGDQGSVGPQGAQGPKGDTGAQGAQGPKGDQGSQGDKGDKGDQGPEGPKGDQGEKGDNGDRGDPGLSCWDTNQNGIGDPEEDINGDGNYDGHDCQGARGDQGEAGPQGNTGPQGSKGDKGDQGAQGSKGDTGTQGAQGPKGDQGLPGPQGDAGLQGPKGDQGTQGYTCWDLNQNSVCDPSEDKNGNGNCTPADCSEGNSIKCATIENAETTDTNIPMFIFAKPVTIEKSACYSTASTTPAYQLKAGSADGNLTHTTTCSNGTSGLTFNAVTNNAASQFAAGEVLRFDITSNPTPTTGTWTTLCVTYTEN